MLYSEVLEQPLLLETIAQFLSPKDLVNLRITGKPGLLDILLQERHEQAIKDKHQKFIQTLTSMVCEQDYTYGLCQVRLLRKMYDYLVDNIWFRDAFPSVDRVVERKLIQFACEEESFSHDALYYLSELYGIFVHAEFDETSDDDMREFIIDTQEQKHYLSI